MFEDGTLVIARGSCSACVMFAESDKWKGCVESPYMDIVWMRFMQITNKLSLI